MVRYVSDTSCADNSMRKVGKKITDCDHNYNKWHVQHILCELKATEKHLMRLRISLDFTVINFRAGNVTDMQTDEGDDKSLTEHDVTAINRLTSPDSGQRPTTTVCLHVG